MEMKDIEESGSYNLVDTSDNKLKYLVLISGDNPFLKIDIIWDYNKNKVVSTDVFRGKNFKWFKITIGESPYDLI